MRPPVRILALATVPLLAVGLAACASPLPLPVPSSIASTPSPTPTPAPDLARLARLALRATGSGTVVDVEDESDGTSFEVHVVDDTGAEQELHLDPKGVVRAGPTAVDTDADSRSDNRALVAAASVTLTSARNRMAAAVPEGRITAVQLGEYQGRVAWTGDVTGTDGVRHDVRIDAVNGSALLDQPDSAARPTPSGGS